MTTLLSPAVVVDADHLVKACAYCCTRPQLVALARAYPGQVSHSICPTCETVQNAIMDALELARKVA